MFFGEVGHLGHSFELYLRSERRFFDAGWRLMMQVAGSALTDARGVGQVWVRSRHMFIGGITAAVLWEITRQVLIWISRG
jgi:hypothetical protein